MSKQTIKKLILYCLTLITFFSVNGNPLYRCDSLASDTASEGQARLKILSWNIGMLPVIDLVKSENDRAQAIANALHCGDYDIIVFQEAFTIPARDILKTSLKDHFPFAYGPVNRSGISLKFNSGIWILSKLPLMIMKEIEFTVTAGMDAFSRKGAVLLEGQFRGTRFQLVTTHLQGDEYPHSIREKQLGEIYEKLIIPYSDPFTPQIICGDFNTDEKVTEHYKGLLTILDARDGVISGKTKVTFDDETNDVYKSAHPDPRRIDYILTRNGQLIQWINRKVEVLRSKWGKNKESLSDHNALEAAFEFRTPVALTKADK